MKGPIERLRTEWSRASSATHLVSSPDTQLSRALAPDRIAWRPARQSLWNYHPVP